MKLTHIMRCTLGLALTTCLALPHLAQAQSRPVNFPIDLIPDDGSKDDDTGLAPTQPKIGMPQTGNNENNQGNGKNSAPGNSLPGQGKAGQNNNNNNNTTNQSQNTAGGKSMVAANLSQDFSCPLFANSVHKDLLKAIDDLSKVVTTTVECSTNPSAKALEDNGNKIKESIATLTKLMQASDPSQVSVSAVDQSVTSALTALGNMGDVVNNNSFLNSSCGRQSMTTGKALLALNEVINGFAPYALFAVSMNAALAPALPFVVAGTVATSSIAALAKLNERGSLNMTSVTTRNAVLQNTCQYTKVARKVRFMQLAQSGKIDKITQELESDVDLYKARFAAPTGNITQILAYRDSHEKNIKKIATQNESDRADFAVIEDQIPQNVDDDLACRVGKKLSEWSKDGKSFPASAFLNLKAASAQGTKAQQLNVDVMTSLYNSSVERIVENFETINDNEKSLRTCGNSARAWFNGIRKSIAATATIIYERKTALESELNEHSEYRTWKQQFNLIENQKLTIKRVERAMQELAKDNSIIDRSELAQRMVLLKAGLFGSRTGSSSKVPVVEWINHTKSVHDRAISAFVNSMNTLRAGAWSLTEAAKAHEQMIRNGGYGGYGSYGPSNTKMQERDNEYKKKLSNLNFDNLPKGSRNHEIACQQLESAWLNWSAALDHLGAIKFFCDMIDDVLDSSMDPDVLSDCRGVSQLNGKSTRQSVVDAQKKLLVNRGFQADAHIISKRLKDLQCPMPAVSVMNDN